MACLVKRRGRYVIDFYDQTGKRRWKTLHKNITKKKAKEELRDIEELVANGAYLPAKKVPLFSTVAEDWIKHKKGFLRESTWEVCKTHTKLHFKTLEAMKINRITTATCEKWIGEKQADKMNLNTLRKLLVTLNQIFTYAVRHRYIGYNPLREAERPRDQGHEEKKEMRVLNPEQIKIFLENTEEQKYRVLFTLATFSGARQGELLGLKWKDFDWNNKQVHIQRTFNNGRFFAVKTRASNRRIDLGPIVIQELKKWKLASGKSKLGLVFPNEEGEPLDHHNMVNRFFIPALKKAGFCKKLENGKVDRIRFHDLRHTYASLLVEQGENIKYIQTQLGHSSPTVTLNVYAHLMKPTNQDSAKRLESTIFEATGSKMVANDEKGVTA